MPNLIRLYSCLFVSSSILLPSGRAEAKDPNQINVGWETLPRSFDPRQNTDANSQYVESLIHCSLIQFDEKGRPVAQLAKKLPTWDATETKLKLTLREDAVFSNGKPVSPEDVLATFNSLLGDSPYLRSGAYNAVDSISAKGNEITFVLKEPDASFLPNLALGILPKTLTKNGPVTANNVTGCGPYQIKELSLTSLELSQNPGFKLSSKPRKNIVIKAVKSEKTRLAKLRAGELDLVQNLINRDLVAKVSKRYPQLKVTTGPGLRTSYIGFNTKDKLLSDRRVRRAIAHAIHRAPIIKYILSDLAEPAVSMLTKASPFFFQPKSFANFDLKRAEALLEEAGFPKKKDGFRFSLSYKTTTNTTRVQIGKAIASQLKKIGIKLRVEPMEWGRFSQDVKQGRVQIWGLTWIGFKDPDILRYAFASESFPPNGGNRGYFSNQKLDELLRLARKTSDFEKRAAIYRSAQELIAYEQPYVYLWHDKNFVVAKRSVQNFKMFTDGRFDGLKDTFIK